MTEEVGAELKVIEVFTICQKVQEKSHMNSTTSGFCSVLGGFWSLIILAKYCVMKERLISLRNRQ